MKKIGNISLQIGDTVDLVLPASGLPSEMIGKAEAFLNTWGLKARYPKDILKPHRIFAQSDEKRFQFLKDALLNKKSKAVWCLRGGYGSIRLLPSLNEIKKPDHSKFFIGISDVTSLHLFLNQKWGWVTYHGSLIDRLANNTLPAPNQNEMKQILFGLKAEVDFDLVPRNLMAKQMKPTRSQVVGGNLVTIQSTLGTPYEIKTAKKFLFFEEIGERGYRMDRLLEHLNQADKFKSCQGLIVGHVIGGEEPGAEPHLKKPSTWDLVFEDWLKKLKIPVFSGMQSGHGPDLRCLPLNSTAELFKKAELSKKADIKQTLSFQLKARTGVVNK